MSQVVTKKQELKDEDLAIQDTLMMSEEERLGLLVHLIVDKIIEDDKSGGTLYTRIKEPRS
jgi:hypothetical protein